MAQSWTRLDTAGRSASRFSAHRLAESSFNRRAVRSREVSSHNRVYGYQSSGHCKMAFSLHAYQHILIRMPLPNEVQQHIHSTIAAKDDQLIHEMNEDRRDVACELAAKGLSSPSVRVQRDIEAIERFIDRRMTAHLEIYLDTLAELGIKIDFGLEAEIVQHLESLRTAQNAAMPPGMEIANVPSMREMYRSRLGSADTRALSHAKNRVRMVRLKDAVPGPQPSIVSHTHHYTASGHNAHVNVGSTDNSSNTFQIGKPLPPTEAPEKQGLIPSDRLAVALCCISGLMTLVPLWMEKTTIWAGGTVSVLALLVIYPVYHFVRSWKLRIPTLIVMWVLIALFGWRIWPRPITAAMPQPVIRNEPTQPVPNSQSQQSAFQPKVLATAQPLIDNTLQPFAQIKIFNDAKATIVNVGKVPIRDVQIDASTHTVDKAHPTLGKSDDPPPQVTQSNYWSGAFQVRTKALNPGEHDQFDLTKMAQWNNLPYSQETMNAVSPEKLDGIFRTFFVFRFTFRHAGTGEKYACYRVHGSYLKFPSQVDDNTGQSGLQSMLRFSSSLRDVLIVNAKQHYRDGARDIQCDN